MAPVVPQPLKTPEETVSTMLEGGLTIGGFIVVVLLTALCFYLHVLNSDGRLHTPLLQKKKKEPVPEISVEHYVAEHRRAVPADLRSWFDEQMAAVEIGPPPARYARTASKKIEHISTGGTPVRFSTSTGLLEIGGTWYQKFNTTNGSYLKEVATPPSTGVVHEESTTVRDFAGSVIATYPSNGQCLQQLSDSVRDRRIPSGLDADLQHPRSLVPD